ASVGTGVAPRTADLPAAVVAQTEGSDGLVFASGVEQFGFEALFREKSGAVSTVGEVQRQGEGGSFSECRVTIGVGREAIEPAGTINIVLHHRAEAMVVDDQQRQLAGKIVHALFAGVGVAQ